MNLVSVGAAARALDTRHPGIYGPVCLLCTVEVAVMTCTCVGLQTGPRLRPGQPASDCAQTTESVLLCCNAHAGSWVRRRVRCVRCSRCLVGRSCDHRGICGHCVCLAAIAMVTLCAYDPFTTQLTALSADNKLRYTGRRGYQFFFEGERLDAHRPIAWSKVRPWDGRSVLCVVLGRDSFWRGINRVCSSRQSKLTLTLQSGWYGRIATPCSRIFPEGSRVSSQMTPTYT